MILKYTICLILLSLEVFAQDSIGNTTKTNIKSPTLAIDNQKKIDTKSATAKPRERSYLIICKTEIDKHCASKKNETASIIRGCLLTNIGSISKECESIAFNQQAYNLTSSALNPECLKDSIKYCSNLGAAVGGALAKCLKEHRDKLTPECRDTQDTEYKKL